MCDCVEVCTKDPNVVQKADDACEPKKLLPQRNKQIFLVGLDDVYSGYECITFHLQNCTHLGTGSIFIKT